MTWFEFPHLSFFYSHQPVASANERWGHQAQSEMQETRITQRREVKRELWFDTTPSRNKSDFQPNFHRKCDICYDNNYLHIHSNTIHSFIQQLCRSIYLMPTRECTRTKDSYKTRRGERRSTKRGKQKEDENSLCPWKADQARKQTWASGKRPYKPRTPNTKNSPVQHWPLVAFGVGSINHSIYDSIQEIGTICHHIKSPHKPVQSCKWKFLRTKIIWGICMSLNITLRQI